MYVKTGDGSIEDRYGKVIFFSLERFLSDIVEGSSCFRCGANPSSVQFNDEHVLPDWVLRRYDLHERVINIPNGTPFKYKHLKMPCCVSCNTLMGRIFEQPLREHLARGYDAFLEYITARGLWVLITWMALIFLKTHLKDKSIRLHRDLRQEDAKIGELYSWNDLHHIHCLARSFFAKCELDPKIGGSLVVLPAKVSPFWESFDYVDLHLSQAMLLRVDEIAVVSVLNDSCGASNVYAPTLQKIVGHLSPIQLREVLANMAFINLHLKDRPQYFSEIDLVNEEYRITGNIPKFVQLGPFDRREYGEILFTCCKDFLSATTAAPEVIQHVKDGTWTFMLDEQGQFRQNSMEIDPNSVEKK